MIEPEGFRFRVTSATRRMVASGKALAPWHDAMPDDERSLSDDRPITPDHVDACNRLGQRYEGSVVLLADALSHGAGGALIRGFQRHKVGPVLATAPTVAYGRSNTWSLRDITRALRDETEWLPKEIGEIQIPVRSSAAVDREGAAVVDDGTTPDRMHRPTRHDLVREEPTDLLAEAAALLEEPPAFRLALDPAPPWDAETEVRLRTRGLTRVGLVLTNDSVVKYPLREDDVVIEHPAAPVSELRGFDGDSWVAIRRLGGHRGRHGAGRPGRGVV